MRLSEFSKSLKEGINDPNIFKAVFLAGGPGAGKGYVADNLLQGVGLKTVNPDIAYEFLMRKAGMTMDPENIGSEEGQALRNKAKAIQAKQEELYKQGRLGLIIDGTAKDLGKISQVKTRLDALGYDTMLVFVNTDLETNLAQNKKRERSIPDEMVTDMWNAVQKNLGGFQRLFGKENMIIIDNSIDQRDTIQNQLGSAQKQINQFLSEPPSRPLAQRWIQSHES